MAGIERDETETMGNEFVGENRSVDFDFNKVNGHSRDFSEDGSAERVGKGEIYVTEGEVDVVRGGLKQQVSLEAHVSN